MIESCVAMRDGIGDCLAQGGHGILGYFFTLKFLDTVGCAGVALDKAQTILVSTSTMLTLPCKVILDTQAAHLAVRNAWPALAEMGRRQNI